MRVGFYLNPILRIRNNPHRNEPDPAFIAALAETAGAEVVLIGWTPGLEGSLTAQEMQLIRELVHCDLLIVTAAESNYIDSIAKVHPEGVVLVASGWDGRSEARALSPESEGDGFSAVIEAYNTVNLQLSALVNPEINLLKSLLRYKINGVVLDTSAYAQAHTENEAESALDRLNDAAMAAHKLDLLTAAAHGLNYRNIGPVARINYLEEIYIGHALITRSLVVGLNRAMGDIMTIVFRNNLSNR